MLSGCPDSASTADSIRRPAPGLSKDISQPPLLSTLLATWYVDSRLPPSETVNAARRSVNHSAADSVSAGGTNSGCPDSLVGVQITADFSGATRACI